MGDQVDVVLVAKTGDRENHVDGNVRRAAPAAVRRPHTTGASGALDERRRDVARGSPRGRASWRELSLCLPAPERPDDEVHGAYSAFESPCGVAYLESYDFSPLRIDVTTTLHETHGGARLTQNLRYVSTHKRGEDFDGVSTSSREAFAKLARYLEESRKPVR